MYRIGMELPIFPLLIMNTWTHFSIAFSRPLDTLSGA